jgi:3-hydroxyacyl-[acyl-carrier-protein] dehydratase
VSTSIPTTTHRISLRIAAEHPALPGHFPGRPIVPGVVLLDCVVNAAEAWLERTLVVGALRHAKFTSMLLPEEAAELELQAAGQELRFTITRCVDSSGPSGEQRSARAPAQVMAQVIATGAFVLESHARPER